jgi:hypothetical protein
LKCRAATGRESSLAVVASTLTIAALFDPLRRRVQGFEDRRYCRKYAARRTLEAFSARLKNEANIDGLRSEMVGGV